MHFGCITPSSIDRGAWGRLPLTPFAVAPGAEANSFQERHGALRFFCSCRADQHLFGANEGCARRRIQAREHTRVGRRDRRFKRPADEQPTTPIAIGLKCSAPARQGVVRRGWCGCRDRDHTARVYGCAARPPLSGACVPKAMDTRPWRLRRHRVGSCLCDTKGKPLSWLVSASFNTPQ